MAKKKRSFEEALAELEAIAERIEQGKVGLEESIAQYEQGMSLVKYCRDVLAKAELRIQKLQERPDGTLDPVRFHPQPADEPGTQ